MFEDFGHKVALDRIRDGERIDLSADDEERSAIARRLGLVSLERLQAHVSLDRDGRKVRATGRVRASLEQSCVATGEPVAALVDEPFEIAFLPEPDAQSPDDEVELSEGECDTVFYDGAAIDLGAAIADTLALSLDPYPRCAEADAALKEAGVLDESEAGPFAALAKLKGASEN